MYPYDDRDSKRTLSPRNREHLYKRAKGRCENPACNKKITFFEMHASHKTTAWSREGRTTLANSVCLCYGCNKLQGTDSWATFLRKQGVKEPKTKLKESLKALSITQLKFLAEKHKITVKGATVEGIFDSYRKAPTKSQYINKLSGVVTEKELSSIPKEIPKKEKRKKRKQPDDFWL